MSESAADADAVYIRFEAGLEPLKTSLALLKVVSPALHDLASAAKEDGGSYCILASACGAGDREAWELLLKLMDPSKDMPPPQDLKLVGPGACIQAGVLSCQLAEVEAAHCFDTTHYLSRRSVLRVKHSTALSQHKPP